MLYGTPLDIYLHVAAADDSVTEKRRESQTGKSTTANHSPTSLNTEPFSSATAHSMYPATGQGGSESLEDVVAVGVLLSSLTSCCL